MSGPSAARRLSAAAVAIATGLVTASAPSRAAAAELMQLEDGPGRDLTFGRCVICHDLAYIPSNAPAMNRAAWQKTIQKMRERFGAPMTDQEAQQILDYLSTHYSGKSS
jgi:sulfite dehydrogenase (cytochrome) subunit B